MAIYTHDFADREASLTVQRPGEPDQPVVTAASYLPSGPFASLSLANGLTETRTFDARYFPGGIQVTGAGGPVLDWTYTSDDVGGRPRSPMPSPRPPAAPSPSRTCSTS